VAKGIIVSARPTMIDNVEGKCKSFNDERD
jgi:hypothetical protein